MTSYSYEISFLCTPNIIQKLEVFGRNEKKIWSIFKSLKQNFMVKKKDMEKENIKSSLESGIILDTMSNNLNLNRPLGLTKRCVVAKMLYKQTNGSWGNRDRVCTLFFEINKK